MQTTKLFGVLGLLALGGALTACGEDVPVPAFKSGQGEAPAPTTELAYPAGPYGFAIGSVAPDLKFYGFHNPKVSADPSNLEEIQFAEFYNPTGTDTWPADGTYRPGEAKPKALWVDLSAQWCPPCQQESATILPADYAKYQPMGAEMILELIEDTQGNEAKPNNLIQWTTKYKTAWPAVIDPSRQMFTFASSDAYPMNLLIDTKTMKVVANVAGVPPEGDAFYTKLESLLQ